MQTIMNDGLEAASLVGSIFYSAGLGLDDPGTIIPVKGE